MDRPFAVPSYLPRRLVTAAFWFFLLSLACVGARAADLSDLVARLDKSEWEFVRDEVSERLPSLVMSRDERAMLEKLLASSQTLAAMALAVEDGDYNGLGAVSAEYVSGNIAAAVTARFGENSLVGRVTGFVQDEPEVAKRLARAALDADTDAAVLAVRDALNDYAQKRGAALRQQGVEFWQDLVRGVVPGSDRMAALGFDPVDLYLQGLNDWADFTARARVRFNETALNCLAVRYRLSIEAGASRAQARDDVVLLGAGAGMGRDFDCVAELERRGGGSSPKGLFRGMWDALMGVGQSTAVEGALDLDRTAIAALIETFDAERPGRNPGQFAAWLETRLLANARRRARSLADDLVRDVEREAARQQALAGRFLDLVERAIDGVDSAATPAGDGAAQPDAEPAAGTGQPHSDEDAAAGSDTASRSPADAAGCVALGSTLSEIIASSARNDIGALRALLPRLIAEETAAAATGGCDPELLRVVAAQRAGIEELAGIQDRAHQALAACDERAMSEALSAARVRSIIGAERVQLEAATAAIRTFELALANYQLNQLSEAASGLERSLGEFGRLPGGICQTYVDRARKGQENIATMRADGGRIEAATAACNPVEIAALQAAFASRTHPFYQGAKERLVAAASGCARQSGPVEGRACEIARARVQASSADYVANRLEPARRGLIELQSSLDAEHARDCPEIRARVERGLALVETLLANEAALKQALRGCEIDRLRQMGSRFRRADHVWFGEAVSRIEAGIRSCGAAMASATETDACAALREIEGRVSARYQAGDLAGVTALLREARSVATAQPLPKACDSHLDIIDRSIASIDHIADLIARADSVAATCNPDRMEATRSDIAQQLQSGPVPVLEAAAGRLAAGFDACFGDGDAKGPDVAAASPAEKPSPRADPGKIEGEWSGRATIAVTSNGRTADFSLDLNLAVGSWSAEGRASAGKHVVELSGRTSGGGVFLSGRDAGGVKFIFSGVLTGDGTVVGDSTMIAPDGECVGRSVAGFNSRVKVQDCPITKHEGTWTASRK